MESTAYLRKGKVGLPKTVTLKLENDQIIIIDKEAILLQTPLAGVTDVGQGVGFIAFRVNGEYYSLEFLKPLEKMFGLVGIWLAKKGRQAAKDWRQAFEAKGITVKKQLL